MAGQPDGNHVIDPTANVLRRQDDLREADRALYDAKIAHLTDVIRLRAEHDKELHVLESVRLNAVREVDITAVSTAADRAQAAIQALAAVTTTNADNVRNALTATAATIAAQHTATVAAITDRIAALEKSSYEGKGKGAGVGMVGAVVMGAVSLIGGLLSIAAILYAVLSR
jgi:hypothetical protein